MSQVNYSTKRSSLKHLTEGKRAQIDILLQMGIPKAKIAREVGISRSTLYNELRRGTVEQMDSQLRSYQKYFSSVGQRVYEEHRKNSQPCLKLVKAYDFIAYAQAEEALAECNMRAREAGRAI